MSISGKLLLGAQRVNGQGAEFQAINPATNHAIGPVYGSASAQDVASACELATAAFNDYRRTTPQQRASLLEGIALEIDQLNSELTQIACQETGLPETRIESEKGRTAGQLRLFADVLRRGLWQNPTLDSTLPERQPIPRPDLRQGFVPLGPVAVFSASNFPLAFSVAGGDTASALAAGCPVIVKGHSSHPGTSELVGLAIQRAIKACDLPAGIFSLLFDRGFEVAQQLVSHPGIKAVGFTGSRSGGEAIMKLAAARAQPIAVFAEMGSINPLYLLPSALNKQTLATDFVTSLTLGAGQFCTNPGLIIALESAQLNRLIADITHQLNDTQSQTMLSPGIYKNYQSHLDRLLSTPDVQMHTNTQPAPAANQCYPALFSTTYATFMSDQRLAEEVFGPASLLVRCKNIDEMMQLTQQLEGQLTATVHCGTEDHALADRLLEELQYKAGRILFNGFPTGVEVSHAMVHGGPYPASSESRSTSVGSAAICRFLRPVCYQNIPAPLLPAATNPDKNGRALIDGSYC